MAAQAAIFDCGGVLTTSVTQCLLDFERALALPERSLLPALRDPWQDSDEPAFYDLERGRLSEEEFWRKLPDELHARLGVRVDLPADVKECRRMLWGSLAPNEPMQRVAEAITATYKSALLTNSVREWRFLRDLCAPHLFDVVIDSCEVGLRKPDPAIYELTCDRLGVEPEESVFVDDVPMNVEAAKTLGMTGILFETTEQAIEALQHAFPAAFPAGTG